jgi:hypothetical protein
MDLRYKLHRDFGEGFGKFIEFVGPTIDEMSIDERMNLCSSLYLSGSYGMIAADQKTIDYVTPRAKQPFEIVKSDPDAEYAEKFKGVTYEAKKTPWGVKGDLAYPCATQNELNDKDAKKLVDNGVKAVAEGANMPCTLEAIKIFQDAGVLYAPGKASNAGGVATSGLEMVQNSQRYFWSFEEVDQKLIVEWCMNTSSETVIGPRPIEMRYFLNLLALRRRFGDVLTIPEPLHGSHCQGFVAIRCFLSAVLDGAHAPTPAGLRPGVSPDYRKDLRSASHRHNETLSD